MRKQPLPVDSIQAQLEQGLSHSRNFVVDAPTGSGKSTRVPGMLAEGNTGIQGQVIVLQPRRVATRALAKRIAWETETTLGDYVGYQVRFDKQYTASTRIVFVTEGILFRMLLNDPQLKSVGALLFDEFHERNQFSDLCLALAKKCQEGPRNDLVIGVMSATLNSEHLDTFLSPCLHLNCDGRSYPVEISYKPAPQKQGRPIALWEHVGEALKTAPVDEIAGNVLVFMPGKYEIMRTVEHLSTMSILREFEILALHGEMRAEAQDSAIEASDRRRIIVSTNIAETSLTIPGVTLVVDSGLARTPAFDPVRGINTLFVARISKASATQRAGRAGRVAPGKAIRLWSEKQQHSLPEYELPELQKIDISEILLQLIGTGNQPGETFEWFESPKQAQLASAYQMLRELGALDASNRLTEMGEKLARIPIHPRFARVFIEADYLGCLRPAAILAAMSQERRLLKNYDSPFEIEGSESASDIILEIQLLLEFRKRSRRAFASEHAFNPVVAGNILKIADQLLDTLKQLGFHPEPEPFITWDNFGKCVLCGFSDHLAKRKDKGTLQLYLTEGKTGVLRRESIVQHPWLIGLEVEEQKSGSEVKIFLSRNTPVREEWIEELFPESIATQTELFWDKQLKRIRKTERRSFRGIPIATREIDTITESDAAETLAREIASGGIKLKNWNHKARALIERIRFVSEHFPEYEIADIAPEDMDMLLEQFCLGAFSEKALEQKDILATIEEWLTPEQLPMMERCAPEIIRLPGRGKLMIRYENKQATVSGKIQQFYDLQPILIGERVAVNYEILAPNGRPVQLTKDLPGFWDNSYPQIKKDLKGRYPKHDWR